MDKIIKKWCLGTFLLSYSLLATSATLVINNGILMGAKGVDVNGVLYDVQFLDGSCSDLFSGCNELTDFPFSKDSALRGQAMSALLEQVLIDSPLGNFDSNPALTNGCGMTRMPHSNCHINIPVAPLYHGGIYSASVNNTSGIEQGSLPYLDYLSLESSGPDAALIPHMTFAVWSQPTVVPVPAAIWLFGSGLLALIGFGRNRSKIP